MRRSQDAEGSGKSDHDDCNTGRLFVVGHEPAAAMPEAGLPRNHPLSTEMPGNIIGKLPRGSIAVFGLLAHSLHHDGIEIALQAAPKLGRFHFPPLSNKFRSNDRCISVARLDSFFGPPHRRAGLLRFLFAD